MNFAYDIYLNLNKNLYDFYDWNKNDKIIHIKKIPAFKVNEETINILISKKIKINNNLLNKVIKKTQAFNCKELLNCALFISRNDVIAIQFDENGNSIKKSYLNIIEECELIESLSNVKTTTINFEILSYERNLLETRKELNMNKFIKKELNNTEENKLIYLYLEFFGKHENNIKLIKKKLESINSKSKPYKKLYDILKLTSTTNNNMI